jgi:hypothetical protein
MTIDLIREPENNQLSTAFQGEDRFGVEELDIIAQRLWRRGSCFGTGGDDCGLCKGEAQQCLAICQ